VTGDRGRSLVLFDVDGTLVDSMRIDGLCFVRSVRELFGIDRIDTDWSNYPDTTDSAIVEHILVNERGRGPSSEETDRLKARFVELLRTSLEADPSVCRPVRGGPELLRHLVKSSAYDVGIATGGWEESARLKLSVAGYDVAEIPIASSNDASARVEILSRASKRVASTLGSNDFESTTYVGDGVWDLRAASALGYGFVGVTPGGDSALHGMAKHLVPDFRDVDAFLRLLA